MADQARVNTSYRDRSNYIGMHIIYMNKSNQIKSNYILVIPNYNNNNNNFPE